MLAAISGRIKKFINLFAFFLFGGVMGCQGDQPTSSPFVHTVFFYQFYDAQLSQLTMFSVECLKSRPHYLREHR
jgi:hypothetical protein